MYIAYLYIVIVHPSSYKTPNYINGDVFILGEMWICLASLLRPSIWSVDIFIASVVLSPESLIASMLVLVGLGGVSI